MRIISLADSADDIAFACQDWKTVDWENFVKQHIRLSYIPSLLLSYISFTDGATEACAEEGLGGDAPADGKQPHLRHQPSLDDLVLRIQLY